MKKAARTPFCIEVEKTQVVDQVILMVSSAQHEIVVTHGSAEKSEVTPNLAYYACLQEKLKSGVLVTRYMFGEKNFSPYDEYGIPQIYGGVQDKYQRTVIIDGKKAMFRLGDAFYYSQYRPLCEALRCYITNINTET